MNAYSTFCFCSFRDCHNDIKIDALNSTTKLPLLIFCIVAIGPVVFAIKYNVSWIYCCPYACNSFVSLIYSVSDLNQCLFDELL